MILLRELTGFELLVVVPVVVVSLFSLVAATTDLWKAKVHNVVTFPLLLAGIVYHAVVAGISPETSFLDGVQTSFAGLAFGFMVLVVPYTMGGMSAADVKLMAAIGAWLGFKITLVVFLIACLAAGVAAIFKICWYRSTADTWANAQILWHQLMAFFRYLSAEENIEQALDGDQNRGRAIPFGAMLAVGVLATAVLLVIPVH